LIRFAQLYFDLPFHQAVARLRQELGLVPPSESAVLEEAARFYQSQLHPYPEALAYLHQRGLKDPEVIHRRNERTKNDDDLLGGGCFSLGALWFLLVASSSVVSLFVVVGW